MSPIVACYQRAFRLRRQQQEARSLYDARQSLQIPTVNVYVGPQFQSYHNSNASESPQKVAESNLEIHAIHHVLPFATRTVIVKWMTEEVGHNGAQKIAIRIVRQFPNIFRSSTSTNLTRALRLWKSRFDYMKDSDTCSVHA